MWRVKYQKVTVAVSATVFARLEQAVFNEKRVADYAVEIIRVAIQKIFPPRKPEDWSDKSRLHGAWRYMLLSWYDLICSLLGKWTGGEVGLEGHIATDENQPFQLTLRIPTGLMKWIEQIARNRRMTRSEATVYAIEYGFRVLDSQGSSREDLRQMWWDIWRATWRGIWRRLRS
jgi:hypothetical protein